MTPLDRKRDQAGREFSASRAAAAVVKMKLKVKAVLGMYQKRNCFWSVNFNFGTNFFFLSVGPAVDWTNQHPSGESGQSYSKGCPYMAIRSENGCWSNCLQKSGPSRRQVLSKSYFQSELPSE